MWQLCLIDIKLFHCQYLFSQLILLIYVIYLWNDQTIRATLFVLHNKRCVIIMILFLNIYRYECIIATLCESLDTLDEPEAKVLVNANLIDLLYFL